MRIIAGRFKGVRLGAPKGRRGLRPTSDRVREALFSALAYAVDGASVLDLFAGTGALGLEALSRGAKTVTFVERDRMTAQILAARVETMGVAEAVRILNIDAVRAVKRLNRAGEKFHIVFVDPPYARGWMKRLPAVEGFLSLPHPDALLVFEKDAAEPGPEISEDFSELFSRRYGRTYLKIFSRRPEKTVQD